VAADPLGPAGHDRGAARESPHAYAPAHAAEVAAQSRKTRLVMGVLLAAS